MLLIGVVDSICISSVLKNKVNHNITQLTVVVVLVEFIEHLRNAFLSTHVYLCISKFGY